MARSGIFAWLTVRIMMRDARRNEGILEEMTEAAGRPPHARRGLPRGVAAAVSLDRCAGRAPCWLAGVAVPLAVPGAFRRGDPASGRCRAGPDPGWERGEAHVRQVYAWEGETPFDRGVMQYAPVLCYVWTDGAETCATPGQRHRDWNFEVGSRHAVLFDPGQRGQVRLAEAGQQRMLPMAIGGIGLGTALIALYGHVRLRRWQKGRGRDPILRGTCQMRAAVLVFPGSNCDRDLAVAFRAAGFEVDMVWHKGRRPARGHRYRGPCRAGFPTATTCAAGRSRRNRRSCGRWRAMPGRGGYVLGICNGFQVLCETRLLPGALMRNAGLKFVCRMQALRVETADSAFTAGYAAGQEISLPVAHHDGNYVTDPETLAMLRGEDRVALRYLGNPNGAVDDIAGVLSANRRVLGLMPHPERVIDAAQGGNRRHGDVPGACRGACGGLTPVPP